MVTELDACEYCGADKKQHGTSVDLELFYQDYRFAGYPAFCSWGHAAAWFGQPPPDFHQWDKSFDRKPSLGDRVFGVGLLGFVLGFSALAVLGVVTLVRAW